MKLFDQVCYRYASILFSLPPKTRNTLQKELSLFLKWIDVTSQRWNLLTAKFLPDRYQKLFLEGFCKAHKCAKETLSFLEILMQNNRLEKLSSDSYGEWNRHEMKYYDASVETEAQRNSMAQAIKNRYMGRTFYTRKKIILDEISKIV